MEYIACAILILIIILSIRELLKTKKNAKRQYLQYISKFKIL